MSKAIKISDDIAEEARLTARVARRSMAGQIEYWAFIGKVAEDNPDLSFSVIKDILLALLIIFIISLMFYYEA